MEAQPPYLFHYWLEENYMPGVNKLDSTGTSALFETIGKNERQRIACIEGWIEYLKPVKALYFDISSISSYSSNLSMIEWGYNRDNEKLPQLNIGMVYCQEKRLPINYHLYPGSIVDVTTLKNCKDYLNTFGLKDFLFILDRGFFSTANVLKMNEKTDRTYFIQPLPFSLKKAKLLIKKYKRELRKLNTSFSYNNNIFSYLKTSIALGGDNFDAHIFYNEKAEMDVRHNFLSQIFELEKKMKNLSFDKLKDWLIYKNDNIIKKYRDYFKWSKTTGKIERNIRKINAHLFTSGYSIMVSNKSNLIRDELLTYYSNKDLVEKLFDLYKNEMDGNRLRNHNDYTMYGKMFVKFIAATVYSEIVKEMNNKKLFKTLTVKELLFELKKVKIAKLKGNKKIVSEISKRSKTIFKNFDIDINKIYGY